MEYDLSITPEQAHALSDWVSTGPDIAPVLLTRSGCLLHAGQGDERETFDVAGNRASIHAGPVFTTPTGTLDDRTPGDGYTSCLCEGPHRHDCEAR